ncbi:MAG TPA: ABC transporter ATP-binding protein [Bacillales bacterium]|nr:ABC transporter ATP-binding protein [Bacillales bacterium]
MMDRQEAIMDEKILDVKGLKTSFQTRNGLVKAVDGIDFSVNRGEILGIVGESGCGKSVTSLSVMGLVGERKNEKVEGEILFKGQDLLKLSSDQMRKIRGKQAAMVFQDPMTSLNPAYSVGSQIAEIPIIHEKKSTKAAWDIALKMLGKVGIPTPSERAKHYPHQFSGGMRQRGVIAMSLAGDPDLLIADEPTTALDVTIQAQVLELLNKLRHEMNSAIVLITHDLGVVAELCDQVAVMYAGKIVEKASVGELFRNPRHPYTKGLLASLPKPGSNERLVPIEGQPPNLFDLPQGCRFANRCPMAFEKCRRESPELMDAGEGHCSACWLEEENDGGN